MFNGAYCALIHARARAHTMARPFLRWHTQKTQPSSMNELLPCDGDACNCIRSQMEWRARAQRNWPLALKHGTEQHSIGTAAAEAPRVRHSQNTRGTGHAQAGAEAFELRCRFARYFICIAHFPFASFKWSGPVDCAMIAVVI